MEHNGLIEMFRENPALAPHFLALLFHLQVPPQSTARVADSTLDQLIPVEFRADLVLELCDAHGRVVFAIVFEVQRDVKLRKQYTWPVYVAVARAERECPVVVLVLAIDAEVAAWASEKIDLGLGLGATQPLVLGPTTVPVLTDPAVAAKEVELAILSAMAHGNGPQGLDAVQTALAAGCPFVGLPLQPEQDWNVACAERAGAALRMTMKDACGSKMTAAVARMLADPAARAAAKRLGAALSAVDGPSACAQAIIGYLGLGPAVVTNEARIATGP